MSDTQNPLSKKNGLEALLARGYLPRELPFCYTTGALAKVSAEAFSACNKKERTKWTAAMTIPVGARGGRRRTTSIPNPVSQTHLAKIIIENWGQIAAHCQASPISFSRLAVPGMERWLKNERRGDPVFSYESIALTREFSQKRLELGASSSYILKADIANFYSSIYTHSVAWALHGKQKAKSNIGNNDLLGNQLDAAVRNGNLGQTKGIPIGPDTSRILSEIIGTAIDKRLATKLKKRVSQGHEGIRWVDDFLLYFQSAGGRDKALGTLVEALEEFELSMNHHKTAYLLPGEDMIESPWVHQLRRYPFSNKPLAQFYDLLGFADLVAKLAQAYPEDSVALYASKILWSLPIAPKNLPDLLSVLWRLVHLDARVVAVAAIFTSELNNALLKNRRVQKIVTEATQFHLSEFIERRWPLEACWLLWLFREISIALPGALATKLACFEHPLVALAALELESSGLIRSKLDLTEWKASVSQDDAVLGPRWMLAYELRRSGRIKSKMGHPFFESIKEKRVSFIRASRRE